VPLRPESPHSPIGSLDLSTYWPARSAQSDSGRYVDELVAADHRPNVTTESGVSVVANPDLHTHDDVSGFAIFWKSIRLDCPDRDAR